MCFGEIGINNIVSRSFQGAGIKTPRTTRLARSWQLFRGCAKGRRRKGNVMSKKATTAVLAFLGGALMLSTQDALARDWGDGVFTKDATYSLSRISTRGWIHLHRVDGEVVHIKCGSNCVRH